MTATLPLTPAQKQNVNALVNDVRAYIIEARYKSYPVVVHVGTVDNGTVEINGPADEIFQKRIRVNIAELTDKQIVAA